MPDKQNPNDPEYDWLYSGQQGPPQSPDQSQPAQPSDPDATQLISRSPGDEADQAEPTQILPAQSRPWPPAATQQPGPTPQQSFGGTFPAPAQAGPRFATPAQTATGGSQPPRPPQGATTPAQPAPPRKRRRGNWWLRGVVILFVAWLVFMVAVPIWAWQKISKVDAEPPGQRPAATAGTTYLLVGSDSREGLTKQEQADLGTGAAAGQRTDTILLLHVPDNGGPTLLLSVPRDSYVDIPGHGHQKINAAYALGGPDLLVQTIEQATEVRVDDYVEVGFAGFVDIVDAVGGIQVCPAEKINDPKAGNLKMSKGCHDVNGHIALDYSRSRAFALGDITRALHQREVITAVGKKAASWKTVVFPWRYVAVNKAAADTLQVGEDVGPFDLARFAWAMAHTGGSNAKRCVVPYSSLSTATSAGSVVIWDEQKADALFQAIRNDDTAGITCTATGQ
ncbi:MAG: LCP family protein [Propionibacteriales bacterium]|nr:LCP family protein [Propionibacteriales bacterium]